jgi:hypothetical protein
MHCWACSRLPSWIDEPTGACCVESECQVVAESCCLNRGGSFKGPDTVCGDDCNNNQIVDACEASFGACCTESGCQNLADTCCQEIEGDFAGDGTNCDADCNLNSTADACDILNETAEDCNDNWVPDSCDLESGASSDCYNSNDVPDECESVPRGACCICTSPLQCLPATTECACATLGDVYAGDNLNCTQMRCVTPCWSYGPQP